MKRICIDRILPRDLARPHVLLPMKGRLPSMEGGRVVDRAISPRGKQWPNGSTLTIGFRGGDSTQQAMVREIAPEWLRWANLKFDFVTSQSARIRIGFNEDDGAWSYVGTDNQEIPADANTMNLGFGFDPAEKGAVILHEFGHCLDGDTLIDGPRDLEKHPKGVPIRDLVGSQPWVYAWKDGRIVLRRASRVWLTKRAETVRVVLRPGKSGRKKEYLSPLELIGTADHPVLLADGVTWKKLGHLRTGDRLCSLYRQKESMRSGTERTVLRWTNGPEHLREHTFICSELYGERPEQHVAHHKNERQLDQSPDNLEWKLSSHHTRDHKLGSRHSIETKKKQSEAKRLFFENGGIPNRLGKTHTQATKDKISATKRAAFATNHIVVSVEAAGRRDVYDMSVPDAESFVANGVVVHNCIGLAHEHQNPDGGIKWNEQQVIEDLSGSPNYWDADTIRHNVLDKYSLDQIYGTKFDPLSIMLYAFPAEWTTDGVSMSFNDQLSAADRAFIGGTTMYPGTAVVEAEPLEVLRGREGLILIPGERDLYTFNVVSPGIYVIETSGEIDTFVTLFGPNSKTRKIAENDDSGYASNARLEARLGVGTYYIQVRHYSALGTGKYKLWVVG